MSSTSLFFWTSSRPKGNHGRVANITDLPYIGRVHDIPTSGAWLKFFEWSKTYGPIYQTKMFGTTHVWISSEQVAHELLSRRAPIYSDRPTIPNLPDNRTSGDYLALLGRTETWKRQRKLCSHLMHTSALASLHSYPTHERARFLNQMLYAPSDYIEWVEQFTSRTVSRLSWGTAHPAQVLRTTTFGLLETISPSGALPNVLSFLKHVPEVISPWKQKERARHELEGRLFNDNLGFVRDGVNKGKAAPSFIRTSLQEGEGEQAEEAKRVVGLMAIAGALTIGSPIQSYLLAMCHYPEWQEKLQDEIDTMLGGECPGWEDREKLPMLRAVVKEVIRWRPPVPTGEFQVSLSFFPGAGLTKAGIPHAVEKDDIYNGYLIPAGATIHALEWYVTSPFFNQKKTRRKKTNISQGNHPRPRNLPLPRRIQPRPLPLPGIPHLPRPSHNLPQPLGLLPIRLRPPHLPRHPDRRAGPLPRHGRHGLGVRHPQEARPYHRR